jgi:hypothetical protein
VVDLAGDGMQPGSGVAVRVNKEEGKTKKE